MSVVCVVLAAGGSRRLGSPKQLVDWRGQPLVVHAVEAARAVGDVAVVLGAAREVVRAALPPDIALVVNDAWEEGMASSVRAAARWAREQHAEALVLHLVDQPHIEGAHLAKLVAAYRIEAATLVGTRYANVLGAPALFSRAHFDALEALEGDRGAAIILRAHADTRAIDGPEGALDVDTPEDVAHLLAASSPNATRR